MKATRNLFIAGLATVFFCSVVKAQINYSNCLAGGTLIYSNAFSGGAVNITNTPPDYVTNLFGGSTNIVWFDASGVNDPGSLLADGADNSAARDSWLLPFVPQSGHVYTLTGTLTFSGNPGNWVGVGFAQNYMDTAAAGQGAFVNTPEGYDWIIVTESSGNVQDFGGPYAQHGLINQDLIPANSTGAHRLTTVLDTTDPQWAMAAYIDGVHAGPNYTYTANPTIGALGITQYGPTAPANVQWTSLTVSAVQLALLQQPASATVNAGTAFTSTVVAGGTPPFFYQWYNNSVPIAGATNASVVLNAVSAGDAGSDYYVVVTNTAYGAITSAPASLTVLTEPGFVAQYPNPYASVFTNYAGASPQFSVVTSGGQPMYYQWFTNGAAFGGQTNAVFTWTNVQPGMITDYCVASNSYGMATSMVWTASVIADPAAPYPAKVLSFNPVGFWQLNEGPDNDAGDDGAVAYDYAGASDGMYSNVVLGYYSGYSPATDPGAVSPLFGVVSSMDSDIFAVQGISFATPANSATFSVEAWVNGSDGSGNVFSQINGAGIVSVGLGGSEQFALDITNKEYQFFVHDAVGNLYAATAARSPGTNWDHIVGVCDEVNGAVSLYVNGQLAATTPILPGRGLLSSTNPMIIGARTSSPVSANNLQFLGSISDVAIFNYALSIGQIANQYTTVRALAPYFAQTTPTKETLNAGSSMSIPAMAIGSMPLGYYWADVNAGTNIAAGVTNNGLPLDATLKIRDVPANWNGDQLELVVTNAAGATTNFVSLTVATAPIVTADLPPQITLLSGASYTYSVTIAGAQPYAYQWYQAGAPLASQTNSSYTTMAGAPGSSSAFYVVITNIYGAVTSSVSTFISAAPATNAYSAGIAELNPAGYWPMHEVEAPAPGDVETNYGTLGVLGAAYYPDWAGDDGAFTRQVPGALTNSGDTDTALQFNYNIGAVGAGAGTWTNEIYIPHTSPSSTLNPPFSVECWLYTTNAGGSAGQNFWGQMGNEGLNAGPAGYGQGKFEGPQFIYYGGQFRLYAHYNSTATIVVSSSASLDTWYYVVLTCDANTNFTLYVNGSSVSTGAGVGKYLPDYWTPLTIGGTAGGIRSCAGTVDDFAVYTNALSANEVGGHYTNGISGPAGAYFHGVTNDGAVIYLRMDAPTYNPPQIGSWPELINFGSVANPGVYTPGTLPGVVAGPSLNGTNYLGLPGTNAPALSGVSSFADAGFSPEYNPTGSNANFSVVAMFRGNPCDNRVQSIASRGINSWQLTINTTGHLVFNAGNGSSTTGGTGQGPGDLSTTGVYNDGRWHQVVAVSATNTVSIYVDGVLDISGTPSGITPASVISGNSNDLMIGADPSYTNNPTGVGRQFAGQVCEVAFFNQALTTGQARQLYDLAVTGSVPVVISTNPPPIEAAMTNNNLYLTWPTDHIGYQLQAQTNGLGAGLGTNWVNYNPSTGTNQVVIPINLTNGSVFYRLIYTP